MKKTLRLLSLMILIATLLTTLAACDLFGGETPDDGLTGSDTVTIKWVQGQKLLKEETVSSGATATEWIPSISGKEFKGWFSDPACTKVFDFTTPITGDTKIYGSFKTTGAVDPVETGDPDFFLIGTGLGSLQVSSWNHTSSAKYLGMTSVGEGVYEIKITMYAGDKFQIATGTGWDAGQWGLGFVDGEKIYNEDGTYAEIKDADGNVLFHGTQEFGHEIYKWDITLATGQDGEYKFTFTVSEDGYSYSIAWELVKKLDAYVPDVDGDIAEKVYFVPDSTWKADGSAMAAWCWTTGQDGQWIELSDPDKDGVYEVEIPEGCDSILFVDFNGSTPNWDDKREQTGDMKIPTTDKVYYHTATGLWTNAK